ncbi:NADP-dependent glyceraldehyde-3-phosphate dehydrogenase [Zongyangia hominis]|uniref:NADP-dependent glyceraldehyde-3-phosphate dehydrogenase n=1 Tax=Zongyangia hominis TaxID=2763677 RepID=A0A926ED40_9FIRM|nr:NADP-dependent glyceraldehyde-3-phosphate dehydrogenase [Zongyangia hominis]MBC8569916.1 NADP-dependent glyceraldehyde-3-phosphate dehydrogenase [Zongyangia hominis]
MFESMHEGHPVYGNLIGGEWKVSQSGQFIDIHSPVDGSLVGKIPAMTQEEVKEAIAGTKENQAAWAALPVYERANILHKAASLLEERSEEIADILVMEIAKDKKSALSEVTRTADLLRYTADIGKGMEGQAVSGENFPGGSPDKISYVNRVPLGTVLAISPFNYPINLSASKIGPALIGGNAVLLKPATQGAISALHLARALNDAGVPAGILNTVTGKGSQLGDFIVTQEGIDFINFTGSTEVGMRISQLSCMKPLLMELGGKDAAIVLEDADLDFAADNIVSGAYAYSGQRCTAVKRILATDKVADALAQKLKERIEALKIGDPRENAVITPLISDKAADFAQELIDDALEKGATLVTGGERVKNLLSPTLLDHVTADMEVAWEEPFAPVLPIIRVKDVDDAIAIANRSEYGLQSSVFTHNIDEAFYVAKRLEVGTVQINNKTERGPDHFPFLGVKASGMGTQGVRYSIEAMTRPKVIALNLQNS